MKPLLEGLGSAIRSAYSAVRDRPRPKAEVPLELVEQTQQTGTRLVTPACAQAQLRAEAGRREPLVQVGPFQLPEHILRFHLAVLGGIGSGKSTVLDTLITSLLKQPPLPRALLYDATGNVYPLVRHLLPDDAPLHFMDPFEERGTAWAIGSDCHTADDAEEIAKTLISDNANEHQRYFPTSARLLTAGAAIALTDRLGATWELWDLIQVLTDGQLLGRLLSASDQARLAHAFRQEGARSLKEVQTTLLSEIAPLRTIAELWKGRPGLSLRAWSKEPGVIIIRQHPDRSANLEPLNRTLVSFALTRVLGRRAEEPTYVVLDEVASLGRVPRLEDMVREGRHGGIRLVIGLQDPSLLSEHYDEKVATALTNIIRNWVFLQLNQGPAAEWASNRFGKGYFLTLEYSESRGTSGGYPSSSDSLAEKEREEWVVPPDRLAGLPLPEHARELRGYYAFAGAAPAAAALGERELRQLVPQRSRGKWCAPFAPRPAGDLALTAWGEADDHRLFGGTEDSQEAGAVPFDAAMRIGS